MDVGATLTALADPTRRRVFELVADSPRSVKQLTELVPVSQPAVSQHLKVLGEAGLVVGRRQGARTIYGAAPAGLQALREWIDRMWDDVLDAYTEAARREQER
ncbi:MAG TPA: metalloregulator ArsR/SmtB family transcription factor [Acidimicrobiia bacterium]